MPPITSSTPGWGGHNSTVIDRPPAPLGAHQVYWYSHLPSAIFLMKIKECAHIVEKCIST